MNNRERKKLTKEYARENIDFYFSLIEKRFRPELDAEYVSEIKKLSEGFNIRLTREEKLKFCKKCLGFMNVGSREIRLNSTNRTKDVICKNCGCVKRFRY